MLKLKYMSHLQEGLKRCLKLSTCLSPNRSICLQTTNVPVERKGPRGNKEQKLLSVQQFLLKPVHPYYIISLSIERGFELSGKCVFQLFTTKCNSDPNIRVRQKTRWCHISATLHVYIMHPLMQESGCYYRIN